MAKTSRNLFAILAAGLLAGPAVTQELPKPAEPPKATEPPPKRDFQVMPLKNAAAVDTARLLSELFANRPGSGRFVADPNTNSLLVQASPADLETIRTLLAKVDVSRPDESVQQSLSVLQLKNVEPDKALEDTLKLLTRGRGFSVDRQRKMVIVYSDRRMTAEIEALLARMEDQAGRQSAPDVQVRVVWLVNGPAPAKEETQAFPDDLKGLLGDLSRLGIDHPRLAAQALVNVKPGAEFQATGRASLNGDCPFAVTGRYTDTKDAPSLHLLVRVTRRGAGPEMVDLGHVQTDISAPPGHLVVLGVTPTDTLTSVFVVQVLRPGAGK